MNVFTPILWLKDKDKFTLVTRQQEAFNKIKEYLSTPHVLYAPKSGAPFKLSIVSEENVIGVFLTKEAEGKEYIVCEPMAFGCEDKVCVC